MKNESRDIKLFFLTFDLIRYVLLRIFSFLKLSLCAFAFIFPIEPDIHYKSGIRRLSYLKNMDCCMQMNPIFHVVLICAFQLLVSCTNSGLKGYKRIQPQVHFKLHKFGTNAGKLSENDLVTIHISYSTIDDSIFFKGVRKIRLVDPGFNNSVFACLIKLHMGDSASFIFNTSDFFVKNLKTPVPAYLINHKRIKLNISVLDIQTAEEYEAGKMQFMQWAQDLRELEKEIIRSFLNQERIKVSPTPGGMYFILTKVGNGARPVKGDMVSVNYEGKFLDGRYFDSTKKREEALEFIYGQEYMVIKGIEDAIGMMREGDRALIILPSDLAFGSSGAGEGIIPPYTALIYELELLKVCKIN